MLEGTAIEFELAPGILLAGLEDEVLFLKHFLRHCFPRIDIDSKQLADVARFRDALGPGTLPLLSALFEEATLSIFGSES